MMLGLFLLTVGLISLVDGVMFAQMLVGDGGRQMHPKVRNLSYVFCVSQVVNAAIVGYLGLFVLMGGLG